MSSPSNYLFLSAFILKILEKKIAFDIFSLVLVLTFPPLLKCIAPLSH